MPSKNYSLPKLLSSGRVYRITLIDKRFVTLKIQRHSHYLPMLVQCASTRLTESCTDLITTVAHSDIFMGMTTFGSSDASGALPDTLPITAFILSVGMPPLNCLANRSALSSVRVRVRILEIKHLISLDRGYSPLLPRVNIIPCIKAAIV